MSLRVLLSGVVALGVATLAVSTAEAQHYFNPAMQQAQPVKYSGTLVATGQNQIQLLTSTNQAIYVMIGPDAEVSVTGTAEPDYLKAKLTVEFVAQVDKGHKGFVVKDKIDHLRIVTPTTDLPVGLSAPSLGALETKGEKKGEKGAKAKEDNSNPLAPDPGNGAAAPAKARAKKVADPQGGDIFDSKPGKVPSSVLKPPGTFTVRGTLRSAKNGLLTVAAGHCVIKATLADDATIDVDMADLHVAQPDDRVTVSGVASPAWPNKVKATSIKIELANPLSGAKKHAAHTAKKPAGKAKKGALDGDDLLGGAK